MSCQIEKETPFFALLFLLLLRVCMHMAYNFIEITFNTGICPVALKSGIFLLFFSNNRHFVCTGIIFVMLSCTLSTIQSIKMAKTSTKVGVMCFFVAAFSQKHQICCHFIKNTGIPLPPVHLVLVQKQMFIQMVLWRAELLDSITINICYKLFNLNISQWNFMGRVKEQI